MERSIYFSYISCCYPSSCHPLSSHFSVSSFSSHLCVSPLHPPSISITIQINRLLIKDRSLSQPTGKEINKDLYNNIQRTDIVALFLATATSCTLRCFYIVGVSVERKIVLSRSWPDHRPTPCPDSSFEPLQDILSSPSSILTLLYPHLPLFLTMVILHWLHSTWWFGGDRGLCILYHHHHTYLHKTFLPFLIPSSYSLPLCNTFS